MNSQEFGKFISTLRKEKGLTQVELAERINVSDKAISRWENGKNYPDIEILEDLGNELGVSISELIACKRLETQKDAEVETAKAFLGEVKKGNKNKKIYAVIVSVILVVFAIVVAVVGINAKKNSNFTEQKIGIVSSDIVASLKNIDSAISCNDYFIDSFELVCNGKREIEVMNLNGNCSEMHNHYSQTLSNDGKVEYCKVYESKFNVKNNEVWVDIKSVIRMFNALDISKLDKNFNESIRYCISLVDTSLRDEQISNDNCYIYKNDSLIKMKKNEKLIGTFATFEVFRLNENSIAQIYVPVGSADALDTLYGYFGETEQGNINKAKEYCTDEFINNFVHKEDIFGSSMTKLLYVYDMSANDSLDEWIFEVCEECTPTVDSALYDNGKKVKTIYSYVVLKDNGKWKLDRITTD